jgi:Tfp pilus assembly major pilin PilA
MMIVIAIVGILAAIIIPAFYNGGIKDHQCIGGYKFTHAGKQIIGQNNSGVPCDAVSVPNGIGVN